VSVTLSEDDVGRRLDVAIVDALARAGVTCSRSRLARAFAAGEVRIDGEPAKARRAVDGPLEVTVVLPGVTVLRAEPEDLPLAVVHEDDALLVVDKGPGMVVHPGPGHASGTLVGAVLHHLGRTASELPVLPGNDATRPGIVHRIDRDTSGLLVIAKTAAAQTALARQFEAHTITRSYLAIVRHSVPWTRRRIETTHGRDPADRRRFSPKHGTRKAVSHATRLQALPDAAVLRFELETGRTHQIRMHARHLGHPVFGDDLYGKIPPTRDPVARRLWTELRRHALHAEVLGFDHPSTGERTSFSSPLPPDLAALRDALAGGKAPRGRQSGVE
jgi:23S rRNA pseudouridine1911/1915/1917 synthase